MKKIITLYAFGLPLGILLFYFGFANDLFASQAILFYRGLEILFLTSITQWVLLASFTYIRWRHDLSLSHAFSVTMASLAFCATFLIVVPVSLDRSVSVFLLSYMSQNPSKSYTQQELEDILISVYVKRYKAIDRRMAEQIVSQNVSKDSAGNYILTKNGLHFITFSKRIAPAFHVDMKFLEPDL